MMPQVVDYSWGRVGGTDTNHAAAVKAAGYIGAVRYLCYPGDGIKQLRAGELAALHAQGLAVGVVWETTADRAGQGYNAGQSDAAEANRQADALGFPADRPIYYAVDFDGRWENVKPYFDGARANGGRPVGIYASYGVVEACDVGWVWQCAAWSGNGNGTAGNIDGRRLSAKARLFQRVGYVLGQTCDVNDVLADDWGGWHPDHPTPDSGDWFDMATEDDLRRIVTEVVQQELINKGERDKAVILAPILAQLAPRTTDAPVLRDIVEQVFNNTKKPE